MASNTTLYGPALYGAGVSFHAEETSLIHTKNIVRIVFDNKIAYFLHL